MTRSLRALILFLILRLVFVVVTINNPEKGVLTDSKDYLQLAELLRLEGTYHTPSMEDLDLVRPPGYPLFLTIIRILLGPSIAFVAFVQLILSSATSWVLLLIGRRVGRPEVGMIAAWVYALSPNVVLWSLPILSEVLFTFLLVLAVYFWVGMWREFSWRRSAVTGALLGLTVLVRPIGLYIFVIWALVILGVGRARLGYTAALRHVLIMVLTGLVFVVGWSIRNLRVHGDFTVSSVGEDAIVGFNLAKVIARGEGISRNEAVVDIDSDEALVKLTLDVIRRYPKEFATVQAAGILRTALGAEPGTWSHILGWGSRIWEGFGFLSSDRSDESHGGSEFLQEVFGDLRLSILFIIFVYSVVYTAWLFGLALLGLSQLRLATYYEIALILAMGITALYFIVVPGAAGQARFRVPAEALLAILVGFGGSSLSKIITRVRGKT